MTINPWDVAPPPEGGDPSEDITFQSVGRALTRWEILEQNMAHIFRACVTADVGPLALPATRAYGATISFQGRSAMVVAAVEAFLTAITLQTDAEPAETLSSEFRAFKNLANKYSARRNEIAHGFVQLWHSLPPPSNNGFALFPTHYSTNKHTLVAPGEPQYLRTQSEWPDFIYTSKEIDAYGDRFAELGNTAWRLAERFIAVRQASLCALEADGLRLEDI